ncbi:response regulator [Niabella beijingensis]|uniref:response regulator transcription factor n=1 Tax=Niabella beijingensis TaxID=2872700 RepID=UPI001CBF849A|nr:response regulator [Niabella beijingensis]MBZ4191955.1 response regulator [Niabella beijingensis]
MKETLLIIDDAEDLLEFLAEILGTRYHILKALNADEALIQLQTQFVDLIISDIMMPGLSGLELCHQLKSTIEYCHIPVILLTAKKSHRDLLEGLETGADAYIGKPFSNDLLLVQVANLLKNRSKIKEHTAHMPLEDNFVALKTKSDETFILQLTTYIHENMEKKNLSVDDLAEYVNMSRATFYRKLKSISKLSPKDFIDRIRLKKAAELIAENDKKFFQIANKVGFGSHSSFGRNFQKHFNLSPKKYLDNLKDKWE